MQTGNLIGEPFSKYINGQIKSRQKLHGKQTGRTTEEIQYLNSRNAWIKLASGVSLTQERYDLLKGNPLVDNSTIGKDLAINNVLFNGLTAVGDVSYALNVVDENKNQIVKSPTFNQTQRAGIEGFQSNPAYGVGGTDFGYSPMPGIVDMDFKCLNRGSIKKASLNIKAHNKNQFDVIDVLYLRLGYSVFLEWGYDKYLDNKNEIQPMGTTLIDGEFWKDKYDSSDYSKWLPEIEKKREETDGNYDGIFGTISNFSWTFNDDGSYDIKVEIISLGDIIESLKVNLPPVGNIKDKMKDLQFTQQEDTYGISKEFFEENSAFVKIIDDWMDDESNYLYTTPILDFQRKYVGIVTQKELEDALKAQKAFLSVVDSSAIVLDLTDIEGKFETDKEIIFPKFEGIEDTTLLNGIITTSLGELLEDLSSAYKTFRNQDAVSTFFLDILGFDLNEFVGVGDINKNLWKTKIYTRLIEDYNFKGKVIDPNEEVSEFQQQLEEDFGNRDLNRIFEYLYNIKYTFFGIGEELIKLDIDQELLDREVEGDTIEEIKKGKVELKRLQLNKKRNTLIKSTFQKQNKDSSRGSSIFLLKKLAGVTLNPSLLTKTSSEYWRKTVGYPKYETQTATSDIIHLDLQPDNQSYFMRLGTLLNFIQDELIPNVGGGTSETNIIKIDTDIENSICYVIDNMVSNDIRKCLISNPNFYSGGKVSSRIFTGGINEFIVSEGGFKYGKIMNTYINFSVIEEIFETTDEKDSISLYKALKNICDVINECLGGVNNLEPVITDTNTIKIIDQTHIPGIETIAKKLGIVYNPIDAAILEVFGYSENKNKESTSNFVRNIGLTTEISKNYATMITIGATSNGSIPGSEATAFSKWNVGIEDRFKNQVVDAVAEPNTSIKNQNEKVLTTYDSFIKGENLIVGLNRQEGKIWTLNEEQIKLNKSAISNYYKYAQAESSKSGSLESSIGFLPFNLKIDMDGIGGIKIYNKVKVNTKFLPSNYPETLDFIITGVNHKLSGNDWTTSLETIATATSKLTK